MRRLLALALLAGCYTAPPVVTVPPLEVPASFERTWAAVLDVLAEQRIPVATIDKGSGLITSAPVKVALANAKWGNCGSNPTYPMPVTDATISVSVRGTDQASTVRLSPRWSLTDGDNSMVCETTGTWEADVGARIRAKLQP